MTLDEASLKLVNEWRPTRKKEMKAWCIAAKYQGAQIDNIIAADDKIMNAVIENSALFFPTHIPLQTQLAKYINKTWDELENKDPSFTTIEVAEKIMGADVENPLSIDQEVTSAIQATLGETSLKFVSVGDDKIKAVFTMIHDRATKVIEIPPGNPGEPGVSIDKRTDQPVICTKGFPAWADALEKFTKAKIDEDPTDTGTYEVPYYAFPKSMKPGSSSTSFTSSAGENDEVKSALRKAQEESPLEQVTVKATRYETTSLQHPQASEPIYGSEVIINCGQKLAAAILTADPNHEFFQEGRDENREIIQGKFIIKHPTTENPEGPGAFTDQDEHPAIRLPNDQPGIKNVFEAIVGPQMLKQGEDFSQFPNKVLHDPTANTISFGPGFSREQTYTCSTVKPTSSSIEEEKSMSLKGEVEIDNPPAKNIIIRIHLPAPDSSTLLIEYTKEPDKQFGTFIANDGQIGVSTVGNLALAAVMKQVIAQAHGTEDKGSYYFRAQHGDKFAVNLSPNIIQGLKNAEDKRMQSIRSPAPLRADPTPSIPPSIRTRPRSQSLPRHISQ